MYSCASLGGVPTPLEQQAFALRDKRPSDVCAPAFPMYVLPIEKLLAMTALRDHEDLLSCGDLVEFHPHLGQVVFVSHQWSSLEHPDPGFKQMCVLQDAVRSLLSSKSQVSVQTNTELIYGRGSQKKVSATVLRRRPLYLWYDFFSCPQSRNSETAFLTTSLAATSSSSCAQFWDMLTPTRSCDTHGPHEVGVLLRR